MDLNRIRIFLLISLFAVGFALFSAWQQEHPAVVPVSAIANPATATNSTVANDVPNLTSTTAANTVAPNPGVNFALAANLISVDTDVLKLKIDPHSGGDIVQTELTQYPQALNTPGQGVLLLDESPQRHYIAQTGLIGKDEKGPDSRQNGRAIYTATQTHYRIGDAQQLQVDLHWRTDQSIDIIKSFTFHRGSYLVDVSYQINNPTMQPWQGSFYGQIRREFTPEKSSFLLGVQMYQGGAVHTADKPYKKISFQDMQKTPFVQDLKGGWAALIERYFLCAWLPPKEFSNHYFTRVDGTNVYNIGSVSTIDVPANSKQTIVGQFYIGPEVADTLKEISPGLNLTIDYGILWPISQLLFWLLKTIHAFVGNWGWSIILVTLAIKIVFYQLSASSYRSMGRMRQLQPRIELLKERHGSDKQQFSTAMMDLYRKEKVNPLGGCLPILIQIPVFIALYYVLLESVELRQAPFILWIKDLSARDPYYVLPLIMGATMFVQQKLNPAPPDPIQAKVMMFMPVVFTVLFFQFPAGLVLYWTVNNLLSIAQQWFITRNLERKAISIKVK